MSKKANPALVGSFVIGAVALVVIAAVALGGADLFRARPRAVVYFDGSVSGLAVGAPVTWLGVRTGSVTGVRMDFDPIKRSIRIPVFLELEPERINIAGGERENLRVRDLVAKGLRAELALQSMVTGQLYVELEMRPDMPAHLQGPEQFLTPEIPAVKSDFETLKETVERLPLKEIGQAAVTTLANVDRLITAPEIKSLLTQLASSAQELQGTLQEIHGQVKPIAGSVEGGADAFRDSFVGLQGVEKDLRTTLGEVQRTANAADTGIVRMTGDLHETLSAADQSFREAQVALASMNSLIGPNTQQRADLNQILRNLDYATQALRSFSEEVERNPNALITGKK